MLNFFKKANIIDYKSYKYITVAFFLFLYIPVITIVFFSFNENKILSQWTGFSFKWYISAVNNAGLVNALKISLIVATAATIIAVFVATVSALVLVRGQNVKARNASFILINLPLMLPEIVLAVSTLIVFTQIGLTHSLTKLIIAHATFCIPFAFLPIRARLQGMDTDLEQAAQDLYASKFTAFRKITLPLIMPGIFAGAMLSFVISFDDFITTVMVSGGGGTTLPVYIFSLVKIGVTPELNAISTLVMTVSILIVTPTIFLVHKKNKSM